MQKLNMMAAATLITLSPMILAKPAVSHPHVFAEASMEILSNDNGHITEFRHVWRFDQFFSASVLLDFDENNNLLLDQDELIKIGSVVHESLAEFNYYMNVTSNGKDVAMSRPDVMVADYVDDQLLLIFSISSAMPLKLKGQITAGVYDPTFYSAIDFTNDSDLSFTGQSADKCSTSVVRPDTDEVLAQNEGSLTDAFYDDAENNDLSKLFATRLELSCN